MKEDNICRRIIDRKLTKAEECIKQSEEKEWREYCFELEDDTK